ncbi:EAL domain-containing protein [Cohnella thailandensis]|uniref:EAL domain-containing protein n=1 Tax=Cohnella thailandensis TaxID=557557 RepID=A0A841T2U9_9BACL|nr:EAL domain-containing protein [Cohnella thailandensis]MBB6638464.1 EAL domain-containing protein [Cohnella thailandensis]MBP1977476.1 EAL domain-containing protein (putative c-di-GMP-specific phosphodiesterase class I) [Cohnella thailandensis]
MPRYHVRNRHIPLRDEGLLELASDDLGARALLDELVGPPRDPGDCPVWSVPFSKESAFLRLINELQRKTSGQAPLSLRCRIIYDDEADSETALHSESAAPQEPEDEGWLPIEFLFAGVGRDRIVDLIANKRFTSHMQPVVQPNGTPIGYEFLLRPLPEQAPFRPAELFEAARESGLHSFLDREARLSAIRLASSHLPQGIKKFINFLPSSLYRPASCLEDTFRSIKEYGMDPRDFVFEVVETERLDNKKHLLDVFEAYRGEGIRLAMDDVGEKYATLDVMETLQPDYVKLDRKWVSGCHRDTEKMRHIDDILERVSRFHGVVLAEGVEDEGEWQYLRRAGIPLLQGYLFGRPSPVPVPAAVGIGR